MANQDKAEAQETKNGTPATPTWQEPHSNTYFKGDADETNAPRNEFERAGKRAKTWVQENPALAVFLAVGAGMITGRVLTAVFTSKPAPLSVKLKRRGHHLIERAQEAGGSLADRAAIAGGALAHEAATRGRKASQELSKKAAKQARKAQKQAVKKASWFASEATHRAADFGDVLTDQAEHLSAAAAARAAELGDRFAHLAEDAYGTLSSKAGSAAHDLTGRVKETADSSFSVLEAILNTIKTAVVAVAVKKITGWIRSLA